ncbi:hypothetical protein EPUS_03720 [Endocarpon pusillum Z07020]|uniref:DUF726-domain-containing protein n=1 Tax=Endocarpon pusillum (strain Z07020 / HMAS-L-300199) TaxID=1263415 RepID=U1FUD3_ENDPU|nr:uncharacterized protein EPUS_03720 [Endocarpon pusillum Z07020]ERF68402.1 hypothetical protein EPUS_03720 [Endocarpon pusillum Z07020]
MADSKLEQKSAQAAKREIKHQPTQAQTNDAKQTNPDSPQQKPKQEPESNSKQDPAQKTKQVPQKAAKPPPKEPLKQSQTENQKKDLNDGEDLTTILDESQRGELTLLIANATESMRKLIEDNFSPSAGLNKGLLRENMTEDEKLMSAEIDPGAADVAAFDRERKLKEQYEKELNTPKMKELKQNALRAFDEWRQTVMERVGQVVNSERTAKGQMEHEAKAGKAQPQAPDQNRLESVLKKPPNQGIRLKFKDLYPPTKTHLTKMSMQQRTLIVHALFLLLLSLEHYNAPSRVLLLHVVSSLKLPLKTFEQDESTVAKGLLEAAKELTADEETKKKAEANKESRKWKVGLATAAGAAVIGISGGMAAPLVSAGVGTIMGSLGLGATAAAGYLGSVAGSAVVVGGLFGAYGGRMTGQMMDHYAREVEDFEFLPVHSRNRTSEKAEEGAQQASEHNHKLRVTICISGWLTEKDEVVSPWKVIGRGAEVFALKWELEALLNLGNAMNGLVQSAAWGYAQQQLIQQTVFADLMAAMWPIGLVKAAGVIDNPFSVAKGRSEKAGEVLADALINRAQGERPVTLIGYSLGARVIYTCLMGLANRKAFGLVESAVLIGAPTPSDTSDWRTMRTVVSARLVNVYSDNDYVLGLMYRTSSIQYGVAGLQKIEGLPGVENVNVSEDIQGHLRYRYLIGSILKKIGFEDIDMQAVEEEHVALEKMEKEEKKNSLRAQKNRLLRRQSTGGVEDEAKEAEDEANEIQKQVADKTQKSLVTRVVEYIYLPKTPSTKDIERNLGNIQKAAADPSEAGAVAMEALKDIQASGQSYAQWAAQKLPHLPGRGGSATKAATGPSKAATGATDTASKTASSAAATAQSYTQVAASYLPSLRGRSRKSFKAPAQAAGDTAKTAEKAVGQVPGVSSVKDTAKPTVNDASKAVGDAASSGKDAAQGAAEKAEGAIDQTPAEDVKDTAKSSAADASETASKTAEGAKEAVSEAVSEGREAAGEAASTAQEGIGDAASKGQVAAGDSVSTAQQSVGEAASSTQKAAGDTAGKTAEAAQSYTSKVAGYLPTFGSGKKDAQDSSKATGEVAKETSRAVSDGSKAPTKAAGDAAKTTSKAAEKTADTAKEVAKGKKPSVSNVRKAASNTTSAAQSFTSRATGYLPSLPSVPGRGKEAAPADDTRKSSDAGRADSQKPPPIIHQDSSKKESEKSKQEQEDGRDSLPKPEEQSSLSRAAGYLPSVPSVPGFGGSKADTKPKPPAPDRNPSESKKKAAPKLERKPSQTPSKATAPKLERKASSVTRSIPKLERKSSEAAKSTPKLEKEPSEAKKSIPKLDRKTSGVQDSPSAAKLERTVSGAQKSTPKLGRVPSGVKSPPTTPSKPARTPSGVQPPKPNRTPSGVQQSPSATATKQAEKTTSGVKSAAPKLDGLKRGQESLQKSVSGLTGTLGGLGGLGKK